MSSSNPAPHSIHSDHAGHHIVPVSLYVGIFLALMVLTAVTVWVAFIDLGPINNVVMLGIAVTKATLVILYFMHVRYSAPLVWVIVGSGFVFLALLVAFALAEVYSRGLPL